MVLADKRFQKRRDQLPKWIGQAMTDAETNQSVDMAVSAAKRFLRMMAQPFERDDKEGRGKEGVVKSSWSSKDLELHKEKMEEQNIRELQDGWGEAGGGRRVIAGAGDGGDRIMEEADEFGDVDDSALMQMELDDAAD